MLGKQISIIYFYVISASALALIVIGVFNSVNFLVNISQYKDYPLRYFNEDCNNYPYPIKAPMPIAPAMLDNNGIFATPSAQQIEEQKKICVGQLQKQRKQQKVDDLKNSITFTLVGSILFLIHFPIARRRSQ